MDHRLTMHCRFPQLTPPEWTASTVPLLFFFVWGASQVSTTLNKGCCVLPCFRLCLRGLVKKLLGCWRVPVPSWLGMEVSLKPDWGQVCGALWSGIWKVSAGSAAETVVFQYPLGAAEGTFCRKDGGRWGQGGWGEGTGWKVESPGRPSRFERQECELVQSIQEKTACPWGGLCDPWCVAAHVTSLLSDSSLLRLMNGWVFSARIESRICQLEAGV